MPDEHIKIKAAGHLKTAPMFQQGAKEGFIVQNQIARFLVRQQFDQAVRRAGFAAQHRQNEVNIRGRELDPAVGLNHFHRFFFKKRATLKI